MAARVADYWSLLPLSQPPTAIAGRDISHERVIAGLAATAEKTETAQGGLVAWPGAEQQSPSMGSLDGRHTDSARKLSTRPSLDRQGEHGTGVTGRGHGTGVTGRGSRDGGHGTGVTDGVTGRGSRDGEHGTGVTDGVTGRGSRTGSRDGGSRDGVTGRGSRDGEHGTGHGTAVTGGEHGTGHGTAVTGRGAREGSRTGSRAERVGTI